eukprot:jgi/Chrzof1/14592/Cz09g08200.t1
MASAGPSSELKLVFASLQAWTIKNYLVLAFFGAFVLSLAWPWLGVQVLKPKVLDVHVITFLNICLVFFISGLTLRTDEMKASFSRRTILGTLFGFVSTVGITPLLGFAVRLLPFTPPEFTVGFTIFCIVPTTLGVGVSLVTSAKGNVGLAILLTVATNVLGVLFIPLWLKAMLSTAHTGIQDLNINFVDIFVKLLISNLAPTVLGKVLRDLVPAVFTWQREHKVLLSIISNTSLAMIIWQTMSSARDIIVNTAFGTMVLVFITAVLIHVLYLAFNTAAVKGLRIPLLEAIATVIMASQKSAPVAVTVITYITTDASTQGVLAVPCVVGQLTQIFLGQPIANYLSGRVKRWETDKQRQEVIIDAEKDVAVVTVDGSANLTAKADVEVGR